MRKLVILILICYGCAPHVHTYSLIKPEEGIKSEIKVVCLISEKTLLIDKSKNVDSIKVYSSILKNKYALLSPPDSTMKYYFKNVRIGDGKFHRLFRKDTIEVYFFMKNDTFASEKQMCHFS